MICLKKLLTNNISFVIIEYKKKVIAMNKQFELGFKSFTSLFEKLYTKKTTVNIYSNTPDNMFDISIGVAITTDLKSQYPVKFDSFFAFTDYCEFNIEINNYQSNKNKIVFDKSQLLSKRYLKIDFYYQEYKDLKDFIIKLKEWSKKYKTSYVKREPVEFTMIVPPDDKSDPNYKKYMKQYWKNMQDIKRED